MATTKAELDADSQQYYAALDRLRSAHRDGMVAQALEHAVSACDYVDGMMQFERRFADRKDRDSVETIDYVFRYAPLVFDHQSLRKVGELLKTQKRIDKNCGSDLAANLASAEKAMWDAHRLWSHLEKAGEEHQDKLRSILGGEQDRWRWIAEQWDGMGLLCRTEDRGSYRISLATRIIALVKAKCSSCGVVAKAAMGRFLEENECPKCRVKGFFVVLSSSSD